MKTKKKIELFFMTAIILFLGFAVFTTLGYYFVYLITWSKPQFNDIDNMVVGFYIVAGYIYFHNMLKDAMEDEEKEKEEKQKKALKNKNNEKV